MTPHLQYISVAFLLGMLWCAALMVPDVTRNVLLSDHSAASALLLCGVSTIVATVFRRAIAKARSGWRFVLLALGLPFVGAALWFLSATLINWLIGPHDAPIWDVAVMAVSALPIALGAVALSAYYVVIPMGVLSQYVMHRLARGERNDPHVHAAT
jgi:hypothetical protein